MDCRLPKRRYDADYLSEHGQMHRIVINRHSLGPTDVMYSIIAVYYLLVSRGLYLLGVLWLVLLAFMKLYPSIVLIVDTLKMCLIPHKNPQILEYV
jgi:hypothetical protein